MSQYGDAFMYYAIPKQHVKLSLSIVIRNGKIV